MPPCISSRRKLLTLAGAVLALVFVLCRHPFAPQVARNQLELTAIDVGQGESLLVGSPGDFYYAITPHWFSDPVATGRKGVRNR